MLGSLFNKVAGLKVCKFFKNRLQHRCSLWILQNSKNSFLKQHLWWLLLTDLPRYSKVSWGTCLGICISKPPALCLALGPAPGPQFVFTGPGLQICTCRPWVKFVFTNRGSQCVYIDPDQKKSFFGPGP